MTSPAPQAVLSFHHQALSRNYGPSLVVYTQQQKQLYQQGREEEQGEGELPGLAMTGALLAACRPSCSAS